MPGYELINNKELDQIKEVFDNGKILFRHSFDTLRNNTFKVKEFENAFSKKMKSPFSLGVTSGTSALRVALAALGVKSGDEVITQAFTFVATVEAIIESRATPVITNIDKTLNMDPKDLENRITKNTKAIIVVHMLGTPARLELIKSIADKNKVPLIEDTAWGCGGFYDKIPLGSFGQIGTFSFDFAKIITTGEGGMINFKDKDLYKKAFAWHDHGHENNPNLPRWEDTRTSSGFNYRMNELQGALGIAQLKKLDKIVKIQRKNSEKIRNSINGLPLKFRTIPQKGYETSDALVFFVENSTLAKKCRNALLNIGFGTKILPEAISWHFAGEWSHMPSLLKRNNIKTGYKKSLDILNRSVALPINIKMPFHIEDKIFKALSKVFYK